MLMAESIAAVTEMAASSDDRHEIRVEPMAPAEAYVRINDAVELTDTCLDAPVSEDFESLRALALLRAAELSGPLVDVTEPEVSPDERRIARRLPGLGRGRGLRSGKR